MTAKNFVISNFAPPNFRKVTPLPKRETAPPLKGEAGEGKIKEKIKKKIKKKIKGKIKGKIKNQNVHNTVSL